MRRPPSGIPLRAVIFLMSLAAFSLISTIGLRPWALVRPRTTTTTVLVYSQRSGEQSLDRRRSSAEHARSRDPSRDRGRARSDHQRAKDRRKRGTTSGHRGSADRADGAGARGGRGGDRVGRAPDPPKCRADSAARHPRGHPHQPPAGRRRRAPGVRPRSAPSSRRRARRPPRSSRCSRRPRPACARRSPRSRPTPCSGTTKRSFSSRARRWGNSGRPRPPTSKAATRRSSRSSSRCASRSRGSTPSCRKSRRDGCRPRRNSANRCAPSPRRSRCSSRRPAGSHARCARRTSAGQWGELQLRRVLENAGLIEGSHYELKESIQTEDGRLTPDAIVKLPGGKNVVARRQGAVERLPRSG